MRAFFAAAVAAAVVLSAAVVPVTVLSAAPALAQDEPEPTGVTVLDDGDEAQPDSDIVRDDETSDTVQRIRRDLVVVGGVTAVALLVYLWHTSPRRRLRIAARRLERTGAMPAED